MFIGSAKQDDPFAQVVKEKRPLALQLAVWPLMQAIEPAVQDDEAFKVKKRLLYPSAFARFCAKVAALMLVLEAGGAERTVGILVIEAALMLDVVKFPVAKEGLLDDITIVNIVLDSEDCETAVSVGLDEAA